MDRKGQSITELQQLVADIQKHIRWQDDRIAELELQLANARKDSSTSSKLPLSDIVKPPDSKEAANLAARFSTVEYRDEESSELRLYAQSQDYFRFMFAAGVEPTNSHSEQQVRHCAIDRRITQGTRSESGQRYHKRMWTAIATCGKQSRSFFAFLHNSIEANLTGQTAPSQLTN